MNKLIAKILAPISLRVYRNNPNQFFQRNISSFNKVKFKSYISRDIPIISLLLVIIFLGLHYGIISFFLFFSSVLYIIIFFTFFYLLPSLLTFNRSQGVFDHCLQLILLSHLHFIKESYVTGFTGQRKVFTFFSLFVGMVSSRVFDIHCFIVVYFSLLFINMCILLYGSNENSFIWKFYVNILGYDTVCEIVGNPWSGILAKLGIKAAAPHISTTVSKPLIKMGGGFLMFDVVVGDHCGFYDFAKARGYDANYLCITQLMGQNIPYEPPVWGTSRSLIRVMFESSDDLSSKTDSLLKLKDALKPEK